MNREKLQPAWEKLVDKGLASYSSLSDHEKLWLNIESLTALGLWGLYANSGFEHFPDLITNLQKLDFHDLTESVNQISALFSAEALENEPARYKEIAGWPDGFGDKVIEQADSHFWSRAEALEAALEKYIVTHFK